MNRDRRELLTKAEQINAAVSRIVGVVDAMAAESQWTAEQRQAIRLIAGRIGQRSFAQFEKERAALQAVERAREIVRQLAIRIATLPHTREEPARLVLDDHVVTAARAIAMMKGAD